MCILLQIRFSVVTTKLPNDNVLWSNLWKQNPLPYSLPVKSKITKTPNENSKGKVRIQIAKSRTQIHQTNG